MLYLLTNNLSTFPADAPQIERPSSNLHDSTEIHTKSLMALESVVTFDLPMEGEYPLRDQ